MTTNPDADLDIPLANGWSAETEAQRMMTHAFIMTLPVQIVLQAHPIERTASGGTRKGVAFDRPVQTMRIVEPDASSLGWKPRQAIDGVERKNDYILLGEWDAVMAVGDTFTYNGRECEIVAFMPDLPWERRGVVNVRG